MEKNLSLPTASGHLIYGTWNSQNPSQKLIIFVHGFTGNQKEPHYFNAVPFFNFAGFDTFRFDFYSSKPQGHNLSRMSFQDLAQELDTVIEHFQKDYPEIILIGHSLGALVILSADLTNISRLVLWDPTGEMTPEKRQNMVYNSTLDKYIFTSSQELLLQPAIVEEWQALKLSDLAPRIILPCQFIFSDEYRLGAWQPYFSEIPALFEYTSIPKTSHCFIEEGALDKLFALTLTALK